MVRTNPSRRAAITAVATALLLFAFVATASAAPVGAPEKPKKPPVFAGYCDPSSTDPADGICTLDEPEGQNPDTYGTVTYDRVVGEGDLLTFDLPNGIDATEVQVCLTMAAAGSENPYIPTNANTCAGNSPDRAYASSTPSDPVVIDVGSFFAETSGYEAGAPIWFTLHVVAAGRTLAVTGGSTPGEPATRTLSVTKDVAPDRAGSFGFTVDCEATTLSATNTNAEGVTFTAGNAVFQLEDGDSIVFTGIADGDECTVTETTTGWLTTANGAAGTATTVSLDGENASASFVNVPLHALTVSKDVVSATQTEQFVFVADCVGYDLSSANNPAAAISYYDGKAAFVLADNASMTFTGIPYGTVCDVEETLPAGDGTWSVMVNGAADDTVASATLDQDRALVFTNTHTPPAPPSVAPAAEERGASVLGVQVTREPIARTGASTTLPVAGAGLVVIGILLYLAARPRGSFVRHS